jgi:uncharacterized metal-binding protein YceD (DUF177 family)
LIRIPAQPISGRCHEQKVLAVNSDNSDPPLQRPYDLAKLSQTGTEVTIAAKAEDLPALARWAEVDAVTRFEARIELRKRSLARYDYDAELTADIVQSCVVTLEPVRFHIVRQVHRNLHVVQRRRPPENGGELTLAAGDDDVPEEIDSPHFDLAGPLLEELSLAIDPYPRAADVQFEPPAGSEPAPKSPFAVLKQLKGSR